MCIVKLELADNRAICPARVDSADITFARCSSSGAWRRGKYRDRPLVGGLQLE